MKNIVLDLDNTLIHCPENLNFPSNFSFLKSHTFFIDNEPYVVFERPFLTEFLRSLRGRKIGIWTAAQKDYARKVVELIIKPKLYPEQKIEFLWHRKHCEQSMAKFKVLKHLTFLQEKIPSFDRRNTLIIDDNKDLLKQNNSVYVIGSFEAQDLDDIELLRTMKKLQKI